MLRRFGARLRQIHISELDSAGRHHGLSIVTTLATRRILPLLREDVPAIIESQVKPDRIAAELKAQSWAPAGSIDIKVNNGTVYLRGMLTEHWDFDRAMYTVGFQLSVWIVATYFAIVRFLSYLDLRIRNEGWEVELLMRAEGARLSRQLT